jgi:trk system potassium uptake protein TrkH
MHMFSTVSLGGLSSHDASFGHWNSPALEIVAMVFMMLAGVSFALYFVAWRSRSLRVLWSDLELRAFFGVVLGSIVLISVYLTVARRPTTLSRALRHAPST